MYPIKTLINQAGKSLAYKVLTSRCAEYVKTDTLNSDTPLIKPIEYKDFAKQSPFSLQTDPEIKAADPDGDIVQLCEWLSDCHETLLASRVEWVRISRNGYHLVHFANVGSNRLPGRVIWVDIGTARSWLNTAVADSKSETNMNALFAGLTATIALFTFFVTKWCK